MRRILYAVILWIGLALAGWLAYALLRALWTIIHLGAPFYDWQWYVSVVALLIGLPAYLIWRRLRPASHRRDRAALAAGAGLLTALLAGYGGFGQVVMLEPERAPPISISFWAYSDFRYTPEAILEDLRAAGGRIYLDPGDAYAGERSQALAEAMRRLANYGFEVYLVPRASNFLSVPVHREWIASAHEVIAFIRREGLTAVRGLVGDAEPPFGLPADFLGAYQADFSEAVTSLHALLDTTHRNYPELRIGVTALWPHYVDALDGDADLSMLMRSPLNPPGGWNFVNLMTYSSYLPPDWRAYYVYLHERAMMRLYPAERVSHLIGLVGGGMPWEPLLDFNDLARDARISRALGVREIAVFQLDGALRVFGEDFVRRLTDAVNRLPPGTTVPVPFSRPASLLFYATAAADALLDARGPCGVAVIGWIALCGIIARHDWAVLRPFGHPTIRFTRHTPQALRRRGRAKFRPASSSRHSTA